MSKRIPKELFTKSGHYMGRPADFNDRIIDRRVRIVESIPGFVRSNMSLMDIGCGNGASMLRLANRMKYCIGIDAIPDHINEYYNEARLKEVSNAQYIIEDVCSTNSRFKVDRIISFEVIEHLNDEQIGLNYYYNSLKTNGLMAITVPNKWWIFETHGAKLPILPWNRVPFFSWLPKFIHERFANARIYTKSRIKKSLEKSGFEVLSMKYVTAPMDVLPKGKIRDFIIKLFFNSDTTKIPFKAVSIFVLARRKTQL